jgi:hypothetical protein
MLLLLLMEREKNYAPLVVVATRGGTIYCRRG